MRSIRIATRILVSVIVLFALSLATVRAAPPSPPVALAPPIESGPVTVRSYCGLRLREGPSRADPIILVLRNGETVYPAAGPVWEDGLSWTFVRVYRYWGVREGFCATMYLSGAPGAAPENGSGGYVKVIAGAGLRLRAGPGLWYPVYRVARYGTLLDPTGITAWGSGLEWTEVRFAGYTYWAASSYLVGV